MKQGISNVVLCRIQKKNFILHFHSVLFTGRSTCISRKQYPYKKGGDRNTKQETMLKKIAFYLTGISLALACACTRETSYDNTAKGQTPVEAIAEWDPNNTTKGGITIKIRTRIGHKKEVCDKSCRGTTHRDCQGSGSECALFGNIEMEPIIKSTPNSLGHTGRCLYPEDISDEETFAMPARSFKIENTDQWVNIPEQILRREYESNCFIINNISFTNFALYPNL